MRILGFSKHWNKLNNPEFTTFRYPRVDRDWEVGESVQIVIRPRTKDREILGIATIIIKEMRELDPYFVDGGIPIVTDEEARDDGFLNREAMENWMMKTYGLDYISLMNKLTLTWRS
jgi:hypothetical protein